MRLKPPFYVISDTHWLHDNIINQGGRPEDHNERMVNNWNSVINKDDDVLHLGDLVYGIFDKRTKMQCPDKTKELITPIIEQLKGNKYLIKGNHDKFSNSWYKDLGFTILDPYLSMEYRNQRVTFTHIPVVLTYKNEINIHGHIHNSSFSGLTKRHANVSVEVVDYTPRLVTEILDFKIDRQL